MWIRTSDRKRVIFCGTVGKLEADKCTEKVSKVLLNGEEIGKYDTEERAIEVLDEICENYQYIKVGETVGVGMSEPQYVFQMPEV